VAASVIDFQVSRPDSLSINWVTINSTPSSFFVTSSMAVVIWASNLVGFRGARSRGLPRKQAHSFHYENLSGTASGWSTAPKRLTVDMWWPPPTGSRWAGRGCRRREDAASRPVAPVRRCGPGTRRSGARRGSRI